MFCPEGEMVVEMVIVSAACLGLGIGLTVVWMKIRARRAGTSPHDGHPEAPFPAIVSPVKVVVASGDQEVMSMTILDDSNPNMELLRNATRLPQGAVSGALKSLVEPLMQATPSVVTAAATHSTQLMEVVINGQMLAATDGNGLRAIAKAGKGFEHARLYEPSNLQNIANAAAIWQLASVVVAQKHLADISATLKCVETKVDGIQSFLEEERLAVIKSAMNYLEVARRAVESGEFLERTRGELERFDIELDRVSMSLVEQAKRESRTELRRDSVGCEGEYTSALSKHKGLSRIGEELALCNEARLANWYLCSIYPDSSKILEPRLEQIKKSIKEIGSLEGRLSKSVKDDCALIDAKFTLDSTINKRRFDVKSAAKAGKHALQNGLRRSEEIVLKLEAIRADRQAINRLVIETKNGVPSAVYLCQE